MLGMILWTYSAETCAPDLTNEIKDCSIISQSDECHLSYLHINCYTIAVLMNWGLISWNYVDEVKNNYTKHSVWSNVPLWNTKTILNESNYKLTALNFNLNLRLLWACRFLGQRAWIVSSRFHMLPYLPFARLESRNNMTIDKLSSAPTLDS